MGLSFKRVETERKALAVAERLGVGVTEAIDQALEDKWQALSADDRMAERRRRIDEWLKEVDARPRSSDTRSWKQIEDEDLYDDQGQPIG